MGQEILHYKILQKLGEGGMGIVYKAEDTKLDRMVAIKFLPRQIATNSEERERFIIEAKAAASLNHPNIATIYAIEETHDPQSGKETFIVMEYIDGQELKGKIESGPLKIDELLNLALQIGEGLHAAHEKEIVHRDIKPANMMLTGKGQVKIMDFGLARVRGQAKLTKEGTTLGTAAYMSPEQARGEAIDHRTDIWSFGVVLYEMVSGQMPFNADYEQALTYSILNEEHEPLTGLRTGVPMELERIVNKALAKSPQERYQHIDEMLVDLRDVKKQLEIRKTPEPPTKPKLRKRKPVYLYAGLAVLIALAIFIGIYFFPRQGETIDSIAVLPLQNLAGDPEQEYIVDGMTEALITELSKIQALKVISRQSVMRFKGSTDPLPEIAGRLNVDAVVEGSVLLAGERIRITAQLIEAATDQHLWADDYERDFRDILSLQKEVARAIAREIKIQLTPQEQAHLSAATSPINSEAHEAYLKGRYFWNKRTEEGFMKAIDYFETAVAKDPDFALAYAGLSDVYALLAIYEISAPKNVWPKAKDAAVQALEIDEALAEAHTSFGLVKGIYDRDWLSADREYKRAIELSPGYAQAHHLYAHLLWILARFDEAMVELKRAQALDPLWLVIHRDIGMLLYCWRQYDAAIEQLRKTLELNPIFPQVQLYLGLTYAQKGMLEQALAALHKERTLSEDSPLILGYLGYCYALLGKRGEAQKLLDEIKVLAKQRFVSPTTLALIHIGLGEKDQAFEWLEKAYLEYARLDLKVDPIYDPLRSDPRFTALLKKMGLEE